MTWNKGIAVSHLGMTWNKGVAVSHLGMPWNKGVAVSHFYAEIFFILRFIYFTKWGTNSMWVSAKHTFYHTRVVNLLGRCHKEGACCKKYDTLAAVSMAAGYAARSPSPRAHHCGHAMVVATSTWQLQVYSSPCVPVHARTPTPVLTNIRRSPDKTLRIELLPNIMNNLYFVCAFSLGLCVVSQKPAITTRPSATNLWFGPPASGRVLRGWRPRCGRQHGAVVPGTELRPSPAAGRP